MGQANMGSTYNVRGDQMTPWMKLRAFLAIFGGLLIHLALGGQYTFGNVMPYLISYLKYRAGEQNVRNVDSLWFNTATAPVQVVAFMLGGVLHRKFGARITTAVGAVIYSASTFLTYFAVKKSFIALAFTQSVVGPAGTTIAYGGSLAVAMQWFPQRSGLAGGIILAGFGGSSSIMNQIITLYINPDNLSPDVKEGSERYFSDVALLNRVPTCYLILGVIYTALQIFGVLLLFSPPSSDKNKIEVIVKYNKTSNESFDGNGKAENKDEEAPVEYSTINHEKHDHIEMKQSNSTEEVEEGNANKERGSSGGNTQADPTVLQLIKQMAISRNFYVFSIILFSVGYGNSTITTLYKAYGQTFILDDHFLALVGSLSSVFNCIGRPFWGAIMDCFRFKVAIQCITAGSACLLMTIIASEWVGKTLFAIWVCAVYFCVCGTYSTVPASLSRLYGVSNLGITYGLTRIATIATSVISAVMGTTLRDVIGWDGVYLLGGGVTVLGFVASFFFIDEDSERK